MDKDFNELLIGVPLITSLLTFGFEYPRLVTQLLSCLGLIFSSIALIFLNKGHFVSNRVQAHMNLGNDYLELYKEIRNLLGKPSEINAEMLMKYQQRMSILDKSSSQLPIGFVGRIWCKAVISKEMDLNWIFNEKQDLD